MRHTINLLPSQRESSSPKTLAYNKSFTWWRVLQPEHGLSFVTHRNTQWFTHLTSTRTSWADSNLFSDLFAITQPAHGLFDPFNPQTNGCVFTCQVSKQTQRYPFLHSFDLSVMLFCPHFRSGFVVWVILYLAVFDLTPDIMSKIAVVFWQCLACSEGLQGMCNGMLNWTLKNPVMLPCTSVMTSRKYFEKHYLVMKTLQSKICLYVLQKSHYSTSSTLQCNIGNTVHPFSVFAQNILNNGYSISKNLKVWLLGFLNVLSVSLMCCLWLTACDYCVWLLRVITAYPLPPLAQWPRICFTTACCSTSPCHPCGEEPHKANYVPSSTELYKCSTGRRYRNSG